MCGADMKLKRKIKNIPLLIISIFLCLILLEFATRVYSILFFPRMMVLDDVLGWRHEINAKKTFINEYGEKILVVQNANGHRGKYYNHSKNDKKYRILVLGDSFTEGVHVSEEDLFSARLENTYYYLE